MVTDLPDDAGRGPSVAALELPARFGEVAEQIDALEVALRGRSAGDRPIDMVLLPEAALTGYVSPQMSFDLAGFAEPAEGPTFERMRAIARETGVAIVYPFVEVDDRRAYNTICAVDADGRVLFRYRKRHPWYPERWASPGDGPLPRVVWRGKKLTAAICFDIHFVAGEDAETLRWADVLLFPSAWVDEDGDGRAPILRDLADTFDLVIVNANWGRGTPAIEGQGGSRIVTPRGVEALAPAAATGPALIATR